MSGIKYWVWLNERKGVPLHLRHTLLNYFETPERLYYADTSDYLRAEGMTPELANVLADKDTGPASQILGECQRLGVSILTFQDADYPIRLRNIFEPPCLLYVRGHLPDIDEEVAVAMVGTRDATPYGLVSAQNLSFELAKQGVLIVSGAASGIDSASHSGALLAGAKTVAVLGCGVDVAYPPENERLLADIAASGAVVSEYPPGTAPLPQYFPARNRIISGLCLATVVVEAPLRSGALITARTALEQGREVFALPGPINVPQSRGSNSLIARSEAALLQDADDILREYGERYPHKLHRVPVELPKTPGYQERQEAKKAKKGRRGAKKTAEEAEQAGGQAPLQTLDVRPGHTALPDDQICILKKLKNGTLQVDELIEAAELPTRRVLSALTLLQLEDRVTESSGKYFSLNVELIEE